MRIAIQKTNSLLSKKKEKFVNMVIDRSIIEL